jgi:lysophospholipase L1-like esterase
MFFAALEPMIFGKDLRRYHRVLAAVLLNTLILFVIVNFILFVSFKIKDRYSTKGNPITERYGVSLSELKRVYPDMSEEEISELLNEMWSRSFQYEPFTEFRERPYRGRFLNLDERGFRITKNQGPWPPDPNYFNVFIFGGSTTLGAGLPDQQTIPAYLQDAFSTAGLEKQSRVYNFGQGAYYSTQERILYEKLIASGSIPDLAIFIDGLNDFSNDKDEPAYTDDLRRFTGVIQTGKQDDYYAKMLLKKLPMMRAATLLRSSIARKVQGDTGDDADNSRKYDDGQVIRSVINRYLNNKRLIEAVSKSFNVTAIFVWQPVPTYKYDLAYHLFTKNLNQQTKYAKFGYPEMAKLAAQNSLGDHFLWCADVQEGRKEPLYVDQVHYSAKMSKELASFILKLITERNLLPVKTVKKDYSRI